MAITRREFLQKSSLLTGAMLTHHSGHKAPIVLARPALDPNSLTPFVDALPIPAAAKSMGMRPSSANLAVKIPYYRVPMRAFETKVHRDMKPTSMWGFSGMFPGPTFDLRSGQEILVEWANELPRKAMAIPRIGSCRENRRFITIRTSRTRRCSGITITPWELTG